MTNKHNPLSAYFRAPKMYVQIPSQGKFYSPSVVEMPENKELPIFAMTAKDEMIMKNPDALLNGEAVSQVLQSCIPNVKNARKLLNCDVDVLLIAVQAASYGNDVEITSECPKCKEEVVGVADVELALDTMGTIQETYNISYKDLTIVVRPFTYESTIQAGITNFQSTRSLQGLAEVTDDLERLRLFNDNFKQIAALNFTLIVDSVDAVSVSNNGETVIVDDRDQIREFLENCDNSVGKAIENKIAEINAIGLNHEMQMTCTNEKCKENDEPYLFTGKVNFDPVNFFTAS